MSSAHRTLPLLAGLFLSAAAVVAVAPSVSASGTPPLPEAFTGTASFVYTGAPETWTVPADVTSIVVTTCGASGENLLIADINVKFAGKPGHGGCVTAAVLVTPGDTVNVRVGGHPRDAGITSVAWPDGGTMTCPDIVCGGGGGGSSDIRIGGDTLADRVLVGGGGGGGGAGVNGGAGGNAGGGGGTLDGFGGNGGPAVGMTAPELDIMGGGGGAFAQEWNGGCGIIDGVDLTPNCTHNTNPSWVYPAGRRGVDNQGGDSADANKLIGGAGGGGYFGGGSGCSYSDFGTTNLGSCGGGGGSSYADPARTDNVQYSQGTTQWYLDFLAGITTKGDDGTVTIRWPGPAVVITTTTVAPTTTLAPTTTALATTTTDTGAGGGGLPATGGGNSSLPTAVALFGVGVLLTVLARRPHSPRA